MLGLCILVYKMTRASCAVGVRAAMVQVLKNSYLIYEPTTARMAEWPASVIGGAASDLS
jgi:hypothetical protein